MSDTSSAPPPVLSTADAFVAGIRAAFSSIFLYVLSGTYVGIGALAHDLGFSVDWMVLSTLLVWAAPAQVILISALGTGAHLLEVALAVGLSAVRLLPMVVALLPILKVPDTRNWRLLGPAHFTAVSMWIEGLRLAPKVARENRVAFCNGIGTGMLTVAATASVVGFYLAAQLPPLLSAVLLFLTPLSFVTSITRNSKLLVDRLALAFGLVGAPLLALWGIGLDLMWTGIVGGSVAYLLHRLYAAMRGTA
jgi:predicted branched-subunit amino acid permease